MNSASQTASNAFRPDHLRHGNNDEEQQLSLIQEQHYTDPTTDAHTNHTTPITAPQANTSFQEPQPELQVNDIQQTTLASNQDSPIDNNSSTKTNNYAMTPDQSTPSSNHHNQMSPDTADLMTCISQLTKLLQLEQENNAMTCKTIDHGCRESMKQLKAVKQQLAVSQQEQTQLCVTVQQLQSVNELPSQQAPMPSTIISTSSMLVNRLTTPQQPSNTANQAQCTPPPPLSKPQNCQQTSTKATRTYSD